MNKNNIMDNIEKIVLLIGSLLGSFSGLYALWLGYKKELLDRGKKKAEEKKLAVEAEKLKADAADVISDTALALIKQYRDLSEETLMSAKSCKEALEKVMCEVTEVKRINKDLESKIKEQTDIIKELIKQLKDNRIDPIVSINSIEEEIK